MHSYSFCFGNQPAKVNGMSILRGAVAILLLFAGSLCAAEKPMVTFDNRELYLASEEKNDSVRLKEFIPKGETLDHWTRLAGLFEYPRDNDVKAVVGRFVQAIKQANPDAQSAVIENPQTGDVIIDFVTWPSNHAFVEFNVFLYSKKSGGGLLAKQYAVRAYGDPTEFLKKLKTERTRLVELMAKGDFRVTP